jgi:hypothetical protein
MILECRNYEGAWIEYNPNEMAVKVVRWDSTSGAPSGFLEDTFEVAVLGELRATVGTLRQEIYNTFVKHGLLETQASFKRIILVKVTNNEAIVLNDDLKVTNFI